MFTGVSGLIAGSVFVMLAFVGFEAAAPLAEEAREPRRTVPRAVIGSCVLVGIFFLFTTYAADVYVGPAHMGTLGSLGGGSPWILFARQLWGVGSTSTPRTVSTGRCSPRPPNSAYRRSGTRARPSPAPPAWAGLHRSSSKTWPWTSPTC